MMHPDSITQAMLMMRHEHMVGVLATALDSLEAHSLTAVPLKGPCLAERIYADPWSRYCTDLDLLTTPTEVDDVVRVLGEMGWQAEHGERLKRQRRWFSQHLAMLKSGAPKIEVHHRISDRPGSRRVSAMMLARRKRENVRGLGSVDVLAPEDEFLYLCLHASVHRFTDVKWLSDLCRYLTAYPGIDWDVLVQRAKLFGLQTPLWVAAEMLNQEKRHQLKGIDGVTPAPFFRWNWPGIMPDRGEDQIHQSLTAGFRDSLYRAALCDRPRTALLFFAQRNVMLALKKLG